MARPSLREFSGLPSYLPTDFLTSIDRRPAKIRILQDWSTSLKNFTLGGVLD
jgi:hypothetical protein